MTANAAFDVPQFLALLRSRGCSLGEPFSYSSETASTNDLARDAAREGAVSGATFLADAQTAGRGRRGRQWLTEACEGLLFSFILRPQLDASRLSMLTLSVGLGVQTALAELCTVALRIKWPNDVLADQRKLAGILVEAQSTQDGRTHVIVGVGINILGKAFAPELAGRATSLALLGGQCCREEALVRVLQGVEHWLQKLDSGNVSAVVAALRERDALFDRHVKVDGVAGVARGIDADGCLLLETAAGVRAVRAGTVEWADAGAN